MVSKELNQFEFRKVGEFYPCVIDLFGAIGYWLIDPSKRLTVTQMNLLEVKLMGELGSKYKIISVPIDPYTMFFEVLGVKDAVGLTVYETDIQIGVCVKKDLVIENRLTRLTNEEKKKLY